MSTVGEAGLENRENVPLQKGRKPPNLCSCNEDYFSGSKFINLAFASFTVIITAALFLQIYYGDYQVVPHGSVATDSLECSKIGTEVLKKGGNSVDAAIASGFCLTVVTPHLTSLDGEGRIMVYNHRTREIPIVVDFSSGDSDLEKSLPRLVNGLAFVHQLFGTLPWKELVLPAANLASRGFLVQKMLVQAARQVKTEFLNQHLEPGQLLQLPNLGNTLQQIADIPEKDLYEHAKTQPIYSSQALKFTFNQYDIFVPDSPSAGPHFLENLHHLQSFNFTEHDTNLTEYVYRVAQVTHDLNSTSQFHRGTATNVAVMDLEDNYVALTTGLYQFFGSGEMTTGGYFLDVRPKPAPCPRLPVITTDARAICGRRLVFGADDVAAATQITMSLLVARDSVITAVEAARFHVLSNGSLAMESAHAPRFTDDVLGYLEGITVEVVRDAEPYLSANVVEKVGDGLNSHSDSRGGGIASRF